MSLPSLSLARLSGPIWAKLHFSSFSSSTVEAKSHLQQPTDACHKFPGKIKRGTACPDGPDHDAA